MNSTDKTGEQIEQLWLRVETLRPGVSNRTALGAAFHELRQLYSDRTSADVRRTCGHGTFETEIVQRGYKPRTVRGWIEDYESALKGEQSSAAKRKARRLVGVSTDPRLDFAKMLPFKAAQTAYREAAKLLHPDHGGSNTKMQRLNSAWEKAQGCFTK
jgi:hypothetical protein